MKIGTIGYRTKNGLGYQVKSYVKHLDIDRVLVVDLSNHNSLPLTDWYPGAQEVKGYPRPPEIVKFIKGLDVVLLAETPLNYILYDIARVEGVKTAVVPNWEFFDYFLRPDYALPDLMIMPSVWKLDEAQKFCEEKGIKCIQLHHPVDREEFPFELRTTSKFLHIAGKPAVNDRNGTWDFLNACPEGKVLTQSDDLARHVRMKYRNSKVYTNIDDPSFMYQMGDILVLPRKYGGNCLPLNEALSSGMPVIMIDISPNNHILPKEWLVPAHYEGYFEPRTKVDLWQANYPALVEKLEWFKSCDIQAQSKKANEIADTISWETLKPKYLEALESLL